MRGCDHSDSGLFFFVVDLLQALIAVGLHGVQVHLGILGSAKGRMDDLARRADVFLVRFGGRERGGGRYDRRSVIGRSITCYASSWRWVICIAVVA